MENEIENIDSTNDDVEVVADTTEKEEDEPKFTDAERKAFARAKVAEAKVKELKAQLADTGRTEKSEKSDGLDYGQKAFLLASGIKGEAETKFVKDMMKESGKSLDQVLESKYFQSELESMRELDKTAKATPAGKRSGNSATDSVDYWMTKPIDDVPKDMRIKVINAKLEKETKKGVFFDS